VVEQRLERVVSRSFGASIQVVPDAGRRFIARTLHLDGTSSPEQVAGAITRGLLILKEPLDQILDGSKIWEIRGKATALPAPSLSSKASQATSLARALSKASWARSHSRSFERTPRSLDSRPTRFRTPPALPGARPMPRPSAFPAPLQFLVPVVAGCSNARRFSRSTISSRRTACCESASVPEASDLPPRSAEAPSTRR
jgi:hypothetical protein